MHEVTILAATRLVHDEAQERLKAVYGTHAVSIETRLGAKEVEAIVDTYMVMFLMDKSVANLTQQDTRRDEVAILEFLLTTRCANSVNVVFKGNLRRRMKTYHCVPIRFWAFL